MKKYFVNIIPFQGFSDFNSIDILPYFCFYGTSFYKSTLSVHLFLQNFLMLKFYDRHVDGVTNHVSHGGTVDGNHGPLRPLVRGAI